MTLELIIEISIIICFLWTSLGLYLIMKRLKE